MLMMFFKYILSLIIYLRCLYKSLLGPEAKELLHLAIELINSSSENTLQDKDVKDGTLSRMSLLMF